MKRGLLGLGLLLGLLAAGGWALRWTDTRLAPVEKTLALALEAGDRETKSALARRAGAQWQRCRNVGSLLFSQRDLEAAEGLLVRLGLPGAWGDCIGWDAECLRLLQRLRSLADSQSAGLRHLL